MSACKEQFDMFGASKGIIEHKRHNYAEAKRTKVKRTTQATIGVTNDDVVYAAEIAELEALRPKTRGECHTARRKVWEKHPDAELRAISPCPFMSCKYHLWLDVDDDPIVESESDNKESEFRETWDKALPAAEHSCALDVVDEFPDGLHSDDRESGGFRQVGAILGMGDEAVRLIGVEALTQVQKRKKALLSEHGIMTTQYVSQMERF